MRYSIFFLFIFWAVQVEAIAQGQRQTITESPLLHQKIKKLKDQEILVCAHRGLHHFAPENSLVAIQAAIEAGVDIVEIDIRTTKDDSLILMHDETIDRTTNGKGKVQELTYAELSKLYLKQEEAITSFKIPTLREALQLAKGKIIANLDLKAVNYTKLYTYLSTLGMQHEVMSYIGQKEKVLEILSIDSLYAVLPKTKSKEQILFYADQAMSPFLHFDEQSFNTELIQLAHTKNKLVFMNALWKEDQDIAKGDYTSLDKMITLHPNIIQTDYPGKLINYLRKKGLHRYTSILQSN